MVGQISLSSKIFSISLRFISNFRCTSPKCHVKKLLDVLQIGQMVLSGLKWAVLGLNKLHNKSDCKTDYFWKYYFIPFPSRN